MLIVAHPHGLALRFLETFNDLNCLTKELFVDEALGR